MRIALALRVPGALCLIPLHGDLDATPTLVRHASELVGRGQSMNQRLEASALSDSPKSCLLVFSAPMSRWTDDQHHPSFFAGCP